MKKLQKEQTVFLISSGLLNPVKGTCTFNYKLLITNYKLQITNYKLQITESKNETCDKRE